eukprot:gnl/MRDRNA2_/MRDRNA2_76515_c0_seq1.p1 gnl/MRDRNA2_/MRDRNA2_76515_c0~~gnl/MRDRNA2_/MRDRNA2_76515_c0_seq1.p1  ORF type:complete len:123 (+),score=5.94 gnl/MRDRNA2_/MRDRNA2_76515_c0_seq1:145-513(+)
MWESVCFWVLAGLAAGFIGGCSIEWSGSQACQGAMCALFYSIFAGTITGYVASTQTDFVGGLRVMIPLIIAITVVPNPFWYLNYITTFTDMVRYQIRQPAVHHHSPVQVGSPTKGEEMHRFE